MRTLVYESDWLASKPFFFDIAQRKASESVNDLVQKSPSHSFHPEGLSNFLDFGYSVLEQTPLEDIRFLRHSSRLWRMDGEKFEVEYLDDPAEGYLEFRLSEPDVIELIRERVQSWEDSLPADQEIVIPLSGGMDSRLLLWCIRDKARVRAYTYGLSRDQGQSTEVVHARILAERLGIRWEQITLGYFHRYFSEWYAHFGLATHAHGMYHFEFYTRIRERITGGQAFLSGIVGDAWAGSFTPPVINSADELVSLGLTHGMRADSTRVRFPVDHALRDQFWLENREKLRHPRLRLIWTIRFKLMLLCYLMRVPQFFGFVPWTPYLDIDIAMAMLNLPQERRKNRQWQRDFFRKAGLDLEDQGLGGSRRNNLNVQAMRLHPLEPLDGKRLSTLFDPGYIDWINRYTQFTRLSGLKHSALTIPKVGAVLRRMGGSDQMLDAYNAYLCIRPIDLFLATGQSTRAEAQP